MSDQEIRKLKQIKSDQELMLKCIELIVNKGKGRKTKDLFNESKELLELNKIQDDQLLMLKCVELILSKNKIYPLNDILDESKKLYEFIIANR